MIYYLKFRDYAVIHCMQSMSWSCLTYLQLFICPDEVNQMILDGWVDNIIEDKLIANDYVPTMITSESLGTM